MRRRARNASEVIVGVRHGHIRVLPDSRVGSAPGSAGALYTVEPTGDVTFVHVKLGTAFVVASTTEPFRGTADQPVRVDFDQQHLYLFDRETQQAL